MAPKTRSQKEDGVTVNRSGTAPHMHS